jgi:lipopolysaccharide/colanic/teichoic acid biosynthesis glycosyltransferase
MNLIIFQKNKNGTNTNNNHQLLRLALSNRPLTDILLSCLCRESKKPLIKHHLPAQKGRNNNLLLGYKRFPDKNIIAVPIDWVEKTSGKTNNTLYEILKDTKSEKLITYKNNLSFNQKLVSKLQTDDWLTISNARYFAQIESKLLKKAVKQSSADVIAVNADPELRAGGEKILMENQNRLLGFRRYYVDTVRLSQPTKTWPQLLFIKKTSLSHLLSNNTLTLNFSDLVEKCRQKSIRLTSLNIGADVWDLEEERDFLAILAGFANSLSSGCPALYGNTKSYTDSSDENKISASARIFGNVLLADNVTICKNAIINGPVVITENVKISPNAVINNSIIGPDITIPDNQLVQNSVITANNCSFTYNGKNANNKKTAALPKTIQKIQIFRTWPSFSYQRLTKRIFDIIISIIVLLLFLPVLPVIAIAIKLSSRGPVFFRDKRQGLHGKEFNCFKFRTMLAGSDKWQEKLRTVNEVDGPQFRIRNDPRINTVGRFLRETYIDEIPQFFNVLLGQMSIIGPRPSPEFENALCPSWRDARLSVRPGITGLWQVCRTRQPLKDFQEWIYYDIKYIRTLCLKLDLRITAQTIKKMIRNFIKQF